MRLGGIDGESALERADQDSSHENQCREFEALLKFIRKRNRISGFGLGLKWGRENHIFQLVSNI